MYANIPKIPKKKYSSVNPNTGATRGNPDADPEYTKKLNKLREEEEKRRKKYKKKK
tara:strand:- start:10398 stop:10565 length:168 start_codon:yes stop_codon:yes gene_type:complete